MGSQYLPSLANVANAEAIVSGAVCVEPIRLAKVVILTGGWKLSPTGRPPWIPTASTIFWMPQRSTCAAEAKVAVLIEFCRPYRTVMFR